MKVLYIEARSKKEIPLARLAEIKEQKIGLITTVQHLSQLQRVKAELERLGKEVFLAKGTLTQHEGQILGCDVNAGAKVAQQIDAFLYLGSGDFHPLHLAFRVHKPLYLLSAEGEFEYLPQPRIDKFLKQKKAAYLHFLHEDKVGVLVTVKPGQENLRMAMMLKERLEKKGKQAFVFISDTIPLNELENFPCKVWINTACPGLQLEQNFLNVADIVDFLK